MKKGTSFFYCTLLLLTSFFCCCKMSVEETNLLRKPDVDISANQVTIIIHKVNASTDYINIYRKEVKEDDDKELNIGVVFPENTDEITYRFIDTLVHENAEYVYKVRYHDDSGYSYSAWSNSIEITDNSSAYDADKILYYEASGDTRFYFDTTDYQLTLDGTITNPEISNFTRDFQPMLILSYDDQKQVFKISPDVLTQGKAVSLRDRIPLTFMDRKIKVEGIVAQQTEYANPDEEEEDKKIPRIIRWTKPTFIKVSGEPDNEIFVPSSAGKAGLDFSRRVK